MVKIASVNSTNFETLPTETMPTGDRDVTGAEEALINGGQGDSWEFFLAQLGYDGSAMTRARLLAFTQSGATVNQAQETRTQPQDASFDLDQIQGVRGNANVTREFRQRVVEMAERLGTRPEYIMAVMSFESGGSFSPAKENPRSHATGLIQFMPDTARGMLAEDGINVTAARAREIFAAMTPLEQLGYVERYFAQRKFNGRLSTLEGTYTAVLSGRARSGKEDVVFGPGVNYRSNSALDWNNDGQITAAEATNPVAFRLFGGVARVQQKLKDEGYYNGRINGRYTTATRAALEHFQRDHNLTANGLLDEATGEALGLGGDATTRTQTDGTPQTNSSTELRRGSRGEGVSRLQDELVRYGYLTAAQKATGPGIFGPATESALARFQHDNHLPETKIYNAATQEALAQLDAVIKRGSHGTVVSGLQDRLVALGYMTPREAATGPGIFGPKTEAALKAFQTTNHLEPSGVLTPETYRLLHSSRALRRPGTQGDHYTISAGVTLTERARETVGQLADEYFRRTGENLRVTDGQRTAHDQAVQMYNKIQLHDENIYTNKTALAEIKRAYNAGVAAHKSRAQIIDDMASVIQGQVDRGVYISRHLRGGAVDISIRGLDEQAFRQAVQTVGGISLLYEGRPPHFHLQF